MSLLRAGSQAPHRESRHKRRELRLKQQADQEELRTRMKELQTANEAKQHELEDMRKVRTTQVQDTEASALVLIGRQSAVKPFLK